MFSWAHFDTDFIKEIAYNSDKKVFLERPLHHLDDSEDISEVKCLIMNTICKTPNKSFIKKNRDIIERRLLIKYPELIRRICTALNISGENEDELFNKMTAYPLSQTLIEAYRRALLDLGGVEVQLDKYMKFQHFLPLNISKTDIPDVPLYDFQKDAVDALNEFFLKDDNRSGLLVMPTGSGKSRTATYFLIREMISRGYQILWIAHRHLLIDQAAECFYNYAGLCKEVNPGIRKYRMSCVSGMHLPLQSVGDNEVIVASIASLYRNKDHLKRILKRKVMIIIDESHHSCCPSYSAIIDYIFKHRKNSKLLGLTATPIRMSEASTSKLMKIYDNNIIYSISMAELISKGILANPKYEPVETNIDFESKLSSNEAHLITKYGDLPETAINKIASSHVRNQIIVSQYLENKERYGKTLIFALNIMHCVTLYEELKRHGVKCGMVYSGQENNDEVINNFKDSKIDVLINVNIMSEGSDVPDIETVFLTRPTQSEGLYVQMVGRGMRGGEKGTQEVYIVDFNDKWDVFDKWMHMPFLLDSSTDEENIEQKEYQPREMELIPWSLLKEAYFSLQKFSFEINSTVSVPVMWYNLVDKDGSEYCMLVFENQVNGFRAMNADRKFIKDNENINAEYIINKYFSYPCNKPDKNDINTYLYNIRHCQRQIEVHLIVNRNKIEPYNVVSQSKLLKRDTEEYAKEIYHKYSIAAQLYKDEKAYVDAVLRQEELGNESLPKGYQVQELEDEEIPFDLTPFHDLQALFEEVKNERFLNRPEFTKNLTTISWTEDMPKNYYAIHYPDHHIEVNRVLNSKDVSRDVIKYLIYHEILHEIYPNHKKEFRTEEHKYPHYEDLDYFLDGKFNSFHIDNW